MLSEYPAFARYDLTGDEDLRGIALEEFTVILPGQETQVLAVRAGGRGQPEGFGDGTDLRLGMISNRKEGACCNFSCVSTCRT